MQKVSWAASCVRPKHPASDWRLRQSTIRDITSQSAVGSRPKRSCTYVMQIAVGGMGVADQRSSCSSWPRAFEQRDGDAPVSWVSPTGPHTRAAQVQYNTCVRHCYLICITQTTRRRAGHGCSAHAHAVPCKGRLAMCNTSTGALALTRQADTTEKSYTSWLNSEAHQRRLHCLLQGRLASRAVHGWLCNGRMPKRR